MNPQWPYPRYAVPVTFQGHTLQQNSWSITNTTASLPFCPQTSNNGNVVLPSSVFPSLPLPGSVYNEATNNYHFSVPPPNMISTSVPPPPLMHLHSTFLTHNNSAALMSSSLASSLPTTSAPEISTTFPSSLPFASPPPLPSESGPPLPPTSPPPLPTAPPPPLPSESPPPLPMDFTPSSGLDKSPLPVKDMPSTDSMNLSCPVSAELPEDVPSDMNGAEIDKTVLVPDHLNLQAVSSDKNNADIDKNVLIPSPLNLPSTANKLPLLASGEPSTASSEPSLSLSNKSLHLVPEKIPTYTSSKSESLTSTPGADISLLSASSILNPVSAESSASAVKLLHRSSRALEEVGTSSHISLSELPIKLCNLSTSNSSDQSSFVQSFPNHRLSELPVNESDSSNHVPSDLPVNKSDSSAMQISRHTVSSTSASPKLVETAIFKQSSPVFAESPDVGLSTSSAAEMVNQSSLQLFDSSPNSEGVLVPQSDPSHKDSFCLKDCTPSCDLSSVKFPNNCSDTNVKASCPTTPETSQTVVKSTTTLPNLNGVPKPTDLLAPAQDDVLVPKKVNVFPSPQDVSLPQTNVLPLILIKSKDSSAVATTKLEKDGINVTSSLQGVPLLQTNVSSPVQIKSVDSSVAPTTNVAVSAHSQEAVSPLLDATVPSSVQAAVLSLPSQPLFSVIYNLSKMNVSDVLGLAVLSSTAVHPADVVHNNSTKRIGPLDLEDKHDTSENNVPVLNYNFSETKEDHTLSLIFEEHNYCENLNTEVLILSQPMQEHSYSRVPCVMHHNGNNDSFLPEVSSFNYPNNDMPFEEQKQHSPVEGKLLEVPSKKQILDLVLKEKVEDCHSGEQKLPMISQENQHLSSTEQVKQSSVEHNQKSSSLVQVQQLSSLEHIQKLSSVEQVQQLSSVEHIQKSSSMEQVQQLSSLDHIRKSSSKDKVHQSSAEQNHQSLSVTHAQQSSSVEKVQQLYSAEKVQPSSSAEQIHQSLSVTHAQQPSLIEKVQQLSSVEKVQQLSSAEKVQPSSSAEQIHQSLSVTHAQQPSSVEKVQQLSSVEKVQQLSSAEKVQPSSSAEQIHQSLSVTHAQQSSVEKVQQLSSAEKVQQSLSAEQIHQSLSVTHVQQSSVEKLQQIYVEKIQQLSVEKVQQSSSIEQVQQLSSVDHIQKSSSKDEVNQSSVEKVQQSSSVKLHDSSSIQQVQDLSSTKVQDLSAKELIQGSPSKEFFQISSPKEVIEQGMSEELPNSSAKESIQHTSSEKLVQNSPAEELIPHTSSKEHVQSSSEKDLFQHSTSKEFALNSYAEELVQHTPSKILVQNSPSTKLIQQTLSIEQSCQSSSSNRNLQVLSSNELDESSTELVQNSSSDIHGNHLPFVKENQHSSIKDHHLYASLKEKSQCSYFERHVLKVSCEEQKSQFSAGKKQHLPSEKQMPLLNLQEHKYHSPVKKQRSHLPTASSLSLEKPLYFKEKSSSSSMLHRHRSSTIEPGHRSSKAHKHSSSKHHKHHSHSKEHRHHSSSKSHKHHSPRKDHRHNSLFKDSKHKSLLKDHKRSSSHRLSNNVSYRLSSEQRDISASKYSDLSPSKVRESHSLKNLKPTTPSKKQKHESPLRASKHRSSRKVQKHNSFLNERDQNLSVTKHDHLSNSHSKNVDEHCRLVRADQDSKKIEFSKPNRRDGKSQSKTPSSRSTIVSKTKKISARLNDSYLSEKKEKHHSRSSRSHSSRPPAKTPDKRDHSARDRSHKRKHEEKDQSPKKRRKISMGSAHSRPEKIHSNKDRHHKSSPNKRHASRIREHRVERIPQRRRTRRRSSTPKDLPCLSLKSYKYVCSTPAERFFISNETSKEVKAQDALKYLHERFRYELVERAERIRASKPKYEPPKRKTKLRKPKPPKTDSHSESSSSSSEKSSDDEDTAMEELERKKKHPDRLHLELWFNDPKEMNDGPLCRCSAKARRAGIRHGIYVGEDHLPKCNPFTNNADRLYHYRITMTPHTNFLTKNPTTIRHGAHEYFFEGFSMFSHSPLPQLPNCKVIRFNYEYTILYAEEEFPKNFTVQGLELFNTYLLTEILELVDLNWKAHNDPDGCPRFHFMPRFSRELKDGGKELLSHCYVLDYLLKENKILVDENKLPEVLAFDDHQWQDLADEVKGMIITCPGMKPSSIRVDQLDREQCSDKKEFPVIVHFGVRPPQLSYAGNPSYQKAWREYVKYRHLLANKPKVRYADRHKLMQKECRLQEMRMENDLKRDVTVVINSKNFYKTGIMSDIVQHAMLLPVLVCHLRFHQSLTYLEKKIEYKFSDRFLLQLALTHPSYRENFGTNPDHARNSLTNCGLRQPQYGDRRIHYMNTRKRGINTLINIMSRFGSRKETLSRINHNERLEFLGDAVVEFLSSIHLFYMFPDLEEGGLATYRAAIVQNQHLAVLSKKLELDRFMLYAHGSDLCHDLELRHAMANCFEALMGALFLDNGIEIADKVFSKTLFTEPELLEVWKNFSPHPLQEQEPDGDRKWIASVPLLQKLHKFEETIGIEFNHIRLLARALTHRSLGYNNLTLGSNQRLEFLGDTVLQLVASEYLYKFFPEHHEGHLSLLRSSLVNNRTQAVVCADLGMVDYAIYPNSKVELKPKDKADLLEAFLGALYVDKDLGYCRKFCEVCFFPRLQDFIMNQDWNDPKSKLQQCCLTLRSMDGGEPDIPTYKVIECKGPTNTRVYSVAVYFQGNRLSVGSGHSIQQAEMDAASNALKKSKDLFPQLRHQRRAIERSLKKGPPTKSKKDSKNSKKDSKNSKKDKTRL